MFDKFSSSLQKIFKNLRGYGKLTERNIQDSLREIRMVLLEADVNFQVARDFIAKVKEKCLGKEVLDSITPGQQVVKHVHDELVSLLGGTHRDFDLSARPATVLLLGLHGAGKTTTAGKLALRWKKAGKKVLLVACDLRRPAAVDQLRILAGQVGVEIATPAPGETVAALGARALEAGDRRERRHRALRYRRAVPDRYGACAGAEGPARGGQAAQRGARARLGHRAGVRARRRNLS